MVVEVGAFEAKTHLSELLERVQNGDRIVITRRGKPVAVLMLPSEAERGDLADVIRKFREIRARTKPGASIRKLREAGRRR